MLCMVAVLGLGLQSAHAGLEDFQHRSHGDIATGDGGWILADCHADTPHCAAPDDDDGVTSADGHHHHSCVDAPGGLMPAAAHIAVRAPSVSLTVALPTLRLEDADLGRPGRVPRASIRLT